MMATTYTDKHGVFCEIDGDRTYEIIHGERCIRGTASRIRAQKAREQALADCDYIIEFSAEPEGMVHAWREKLHRSQPITWQAQQEISRKAEELQEQRRTARIAAE